MKKNILIFITLCGSFLYGQFAEVTVQLDVQRLNDRERQDLQGLEMAVSQFFTASTWSDDITDLEIFLDIQMVFQSTVAIGNEKYYQAQVLFDNQQDQRYFVRDVVFPYSPGRSISLSMIFDPMASFLEFYAYIFIAGELDTYDVLGGSPYYAKATALAVQGENDPHVNQGWSERLKTAERLAASQDLRKAKAYFYQAFDILAEEKPSLQELQKALTLFHASIDKVVTREGQERYLSIFLSGHAEETAEMLAIAGMWEELADMRELNPDSERVYQGYLENRKTK
jgi:hypothetical protein